MASPSTAVPKTSVSNTANPSSTPSTFVGPVQNPPTPSSGSKKATSAETYQEERRNLTDAEIQAYRELLFGGKAYAEYVDAHGDLSDAYEKYRNKNAGNMSAMTKGEWGKWHYEKYGQDEVDKGRKVDMITNPGASTESQVGSLIQGMSDVQGEATFAALTADVLKQTVNALNKAKAEEDKMAFFKGMPGFSDVYNLKSNIVNSLIGDSGLGGYLSLMGEKDIEKKLEDAVGGITGSDNSVEYNWQKWFDETLTKRYEDLSEIESPVDAEKTYQIEKQFAQSFITDYLKPRFDYSRSMNEFVDYINVRPSDQNVLQTQTVSNKLKELGDQKARKFLEDLQKASGGIGKFDADFYFKPTGNPEKEISYSNQEMKVNNDWSRAKADPNEVFNGKSWQQWSYEYGLNLNDKEDFAKLHYEISGKNLNFDPSSDYATTKDLLAYINEELAPELAKEKESFGSNVFMDFVPVEQYSDALLKNIDGFTEFDDSWKDFFEKNNIDPEQGLDEVKDLVKEALRTGSATDVRMGIEALNKQKKKPTQELLGIGYIQRDEDYQPSDEYESNTYLYKLAQKSGYKGTEEDFYKEDFMEGMTPEDQNLMGDVMSGDFLKSFKLDFFSSDPFGAFDVMDSLESKFDLFGNMEKEAEIYNKEDDKETDYFDLFGDQEESDDDDLSGLTSLFGY